MHAVGTISSWKTHVRVALPLAGRGLEKLMRFSLSETKCRGDHASTDFSLL